MKREIFFMILFISVLFSCNNEPVFPDPGFDTVSDVKDTVRRDTIDTYYLEMRIKAPNGVSMIQILNGLSYKELNRLDQYNGKKDFVLRYPVDLRGITEKDTTMNFIIKVVDNDMRSYNKAFALTIKPFSAPTVTVSGVEGTLGLVSPVFELKAFFETGLNCIHSYELLFDGNTIDRGELGDTLSEYHYSYLCDLKMQKGQNYELQIRLTDNKGTTKEKTLEISLIDIEPVTKVMVNRFQGGDVMIQCEWEFHYNEENPEHLDSITGLNYIYTLQGIKTNPTKYCFEYNDVGMVTHVENWGFANSTYSKQEAWDYVYDEQNRLTEITVDPSTELSPIYNMRFTEWYPDGRVKNFAYEKDYPVMEELAWQISPSGEAIVAEVFFHLKKRSLATKRSAVVIPSYLQGLPPFLPLIPISETLEKFRNLLFWKYGVETVHYYDPAKGTNYEGYDSVPPAMKYSFITNINGRLEKMLQYKIDSWGGGMALSNEYIFIYQ